MNILYDTIMLYVNQPYSWAGDDPILGFDCSGVTQEILWTTGELNPKDKTLPGELNPKDKTAQGLFDWYHVNSRGEWNSWSLGALVWYGKSVTKITHVAICIDQYRCLTASGGGPHVKTREDAAKYNAFTKIRLIDYRSDRVAIIKPRYSKIGMF